MPLVLDYEHVPYTTKLKSFAKGIPTYLKRYISNLLPVVYWIHRYNLTWLVSDVISGVTVGIVAVPQGMGYAKIANLPPVSSRYTHTLADINFYGSNMDFILHLLVYVFIFSLVHQKILVSVLPRSCHYS